MLTRSENSEFRLNNDHPLLGQQARSGNPPGSGLLSLAGKPRYYGLYALRRLCWISEIVWLVIHIKANVCTVNCARSWV